MLKRQSVNRISFLLLSTVMLMESCPTNGQNLKNVPIIGQGIRRVEQFRQDLHQWEQTVRGFRRDHNFSLMLGVATGSYQFERVGTVSDQSSAVTSYLTRFEYAFHLQFFGPIGGMLGSSIGYGLDVATDFPARTAELVGYPGLVAGLVWNLNPGIRLGVAVDYHLERYEGVGEQDGSAPDNALGLTTRSLATVVSVDVFYSLTWAIRAEFHDRWISYQRPGESDDLPLDASFFREDRWLAVGTTLHLL